MGQSLPPVQKKASRGFSVMMLLLSFLALLLMVSAVLCWHAYGGVKRFDTHEPIRISGIKEPPELLISPRESPPTDEERKYMAAANKLEGTTEADAPPQFDGMLKQFPNVRDLYSARAVFRCMKGDASGAKNDLDQAFATDKNLITLDPDHGDANELVAMRAKLELAQGQEHAAMADVIRILDSQSTNIGFLTWGEKLTDKPHTVCDWTPGDLETLVSDSKGDPRALIFSGLVYSAVAQHDKDAFPLAEEAFAKAIAAGDLPAETKFYAAVGFQEATLFTRPDSEWEAREQHLIELYSAAIEADPKNERAYAERAEAYSELRDYEHAIQDYNQAIQLKPSDYGLWNDRGLLERGNVR